MKNLNTKMENTHTLSDYQIKNHIKEVVIPGVYETLIDDYGFASKDYNGHIYDDIHEIMKKSSTHIKPKELLRLLIYVRLNQSIN